MTTQSSIREIFQRLACLSLAVCLSLVSLVVTINVLVAVGDQPETAAQDAETYLPAIRGTDGPAGIYYCYEYEFGLIWSADVITLNTDGSSEYEYCPPYVNQVTGTWVYTPSIQQVGFSNFRWVTATFTAPDRLWARRYLSHVGFEIATQCFRVEPPGSCFDPPWNQ